MKPIIKINKISKKYKTGERRPYLTLRDSIMDLINLPKNLFSNKSKSLKKNEFWALKDVSLEVHSGEVIGVIGRNGAGKSTLLKILSRITPPTNGSFTLNGRVSSLLEVGTGFHQELTGRENIYLNGAILGMSRSEINSKIKQIIDFSEIGKFIDTPVKKYSSGMGVRLAFAVAAHLDPEILLIDEVLAVGDVAFQKKCLGKMQSVSKEKGRTIFFVSHNLNAIRSLCTKVILLKKGKITYSGNPQKAINKYLSEIDTNSYEKKWSINKQPKNNSINIESLKIVDENKKKINQITTDTTFTVEIKYQVIKPTSAGLTILLDDSQNNEVFSSINNHEKNWYRKTMKKGSYTSYCTIPGKLLNNGRYYLGLIIFGSNFSDSKYVDNILSLDIQDDLGVRGDFYGDFSGVIRPLLKWETEKS